MTTTIYTATIESLTCSECGIVYGLESTYRARRRKDHDTWWCPNGHGQCYRGKTDEEKRIEELEAQNASLAGERRALLDADEALSMDVREARGRAVRYLSNRALRGAFWRGHEDRNCGREVGCCPYETGRGGFRRAWFDGFGADDPEHATVDD
jgi:hypothetical protein